MEYLRYMATSIGKESFLKYEEDILLHQMEELKKDLEAIYKLRDKYGNNSVSVNGNSHVTKAKAIEIKRQINHSEIPNEYSGNLTWEQRMMVILKLHGPLYVDEVIKHIRILQPAISEKTARNVATNKLSKLYRNKKIHAITTGKKYLYQL